MERPRSATKPKREWKGLSKFLVWNPESLEDIDPRYRGLYQYVTPIKLALFCLFAVIGTEARIPAIDDSFGVGYGDFWIAMMLGSSVVALVACAFYPVAKRLEMVAVIVLTAFMGIYAIAVLIQAIALGDVNRGAFGAAVFIFLVFPTWIVIDLLYDVRPKEAVPEK